MNAILCVYNGDLLGIDNKMPWEVFPQLKKLPQIKKDLKFFKNKTLQGILVMGSKTWQSLACKTLPNRKKHIIITGKPKSYSASHETEFLKLEEFKEKYGNEKNVWVIGGFNLLKQIADDCELIYIHHLNIPADLLKDIDEKRIIHYENIEKFLPHKKYSMKIVFKDNRVLEIIRNK